MGVQRGARPHAFRAFSREGERARQVKTARPLVAAAPALEYGFTDVDGKQPRPLTLEDV